MERLGGRCFDDVVLSFEDERGRVTDVSMEVAVRVRLPLDEEVYAASIWPRAKDCQSVVNGVVEVGAPFEMYPFDAVRGVARNGARL